MKTGRRMRAAGVTLAGLALVLSNGGSATATHAPYGYETTLKVCEKGSATNCVTATQTHSGRTVTGTLTLSAGDVVTVDFDILADNTTGGSWSTTNYGASKPYDIVLGPTDYFSSAPSFSCYASRVPQNHVVTGTLPGNDAAEPVAAGNELREELATTYVAESTDSSGVFQTNRVLPNPMPVLGASTVGNAQICVQSVEQYGMADPNAQVGPYPGLLFNSGYCQPSCSTYNATPRLVQQVPVTVVP